MAIEVNYWAYRHWWTSPTPWLQLLPPSYLVFILLTWDPLNYQTISCRGCTITTNPEYIPVIGSSVPKYWRKLSIKPKLLSPTKLNKMNFNKLYGFLSVKKFESVGRNPPGDWAGWTTPGTGGREEMISHISSRPCQLMSTGSVESSIVVLILIINFSNASFTHPSCDILSVTDWPIRKGFIEFSLSYIFFW